MLKLRLDNIPAPKKKSQPVTCRPAWYKATEDEKYCYTMVLNDKLSNLLVPDSLNCSDVHCSDITHSQERDGLMIDIISQLIETSFENIPLSMNGKTVHDEYHFSPQIRISNIFEISILHEYEYEFIRDIEFGPNTNMNIFVHAQYSNIRIF